VSGKKFNTKLSYGGLYEMAEKKYYIVLEGGYLRIYQNSILSAHVPKKNE